MLPLTWLLAGAAGIGVVLGLGKIYSEWQRYLAASQRPPQPWDIG